VAAAYDLGPLPSSGLLDAGAIDDAALSAHPALRGGLLALKYGTRPRSQRSKLAEVWKNVVGRLPLNETIVYLARAYREVDEATLLKTIRQLSPEKESEVMRLSIAETWQQEGRLRGLEEGRTEGRAEGRSLERADALKRVLRSRFGPLSSDYERAIDTASFDRLGAWLDVCGSTPSLTDLFGT
jgi:hypothetical protein